ncbi:MAG: EF-1 guanine nucleotide exchange domain-containing protein [Synechococcaceae cyanobacterium]|nr:EF-1 guanine nucleotide exchange domain-containing protein [Synechococcaceae cyanobacterium]
MPLTALECPDGVCHAHHGGHAVAREDVRRNLDAHGAGWCERLAERVYEISVDSFCQTVMPNLQQQGWQRRHLDWEFKLNSEPAEIERTVVDGTINAMESFLRSSEVQRLFVKELVQGTLAEASQNALRGRGIRYLIEEELLAVLEERREELLDRMASRMLEDADGDFERARCCAAEDLREVEHLLVNHAEAVA